MDLQSRWVDNALTLMLTMKILVIFVWNYDIDNKWCGIWRRRTRSGADRSRAGGSREGAASPSGAALFTRQPLPRHSLHLPGFICIKASQNVGSTGPFCAGNRKMWPSFWPRITLTVAATVVGPAAVNGPVIPTSPVAEVRQGDDLSEGREQHSCNRPGHIGRTGGVTVRKWTNATHYELDTL